MRGALLGKKLGMTSLFTDDGRQLPCTVVEAGPCSVVQVKDKDIDGYSAVQLGYGKIAERHLNKPLKGHFGNAGVEPKRYLKEFRNPESEYNVGDELTVEQFQTGDRIRVSGKSIGRGFQGVVKRHHFGGVGMMSHGQSDRQRHGGSVGQSSYPSKIMKGIKMPGRMGGKRISVRNLEVVEVIPDQNLILIRGSVPGPKNQLLELVKQ